MRSFGTKTADFEATVVGVSVGAKARPEGEASALDRAGPRFQTESQNEEPQSDTVCHETESGPAQRAASAPQAANDERVRDERVRDERVRDEPVRGGRDPAPSDGLNVISVGQSAPREPSVEGPPVVPSFTLARSETASVSDPRIAAQTAAGRAARRIHIYGIREESARGLTLPETLRIAREERGLSLDQASQTLRIKRDNLAALENGTYDLLPGTPYALGYIRSYAGLLGLSAEDCVARFKAEINEAPAAPLGAMVFPDAPAESTLPHGTSVIFLALLLIGALAGGYMITMPDSAPVETVEAGSTAEPAAPRRTEPARTRVAPPREEAIRNPARLAERQTAADGNASAGPAASPARSLTAALIGDATLRGEIIEDGSAAAEPVELAMAALDGAQGGPLELDLAEPEAAQSEGVVQRAQQPAVSGAEPAGTQGALPSGPVSVSDLPVDLRRNPSDTDSIVPVAGPQTDQPDQADTVPSEPASVISEPEPDPAGTLTADPATEDAAPVAAEPAKIVLRAIGESWIQIRDSAGTIMTEQTLPSGAFYTIPAGSGLELAARNPEGIEVILDGRFMGTLGSSAEGMRRIALTGPAIEKAFAAR